MIPRKTVVSLLLCVVLAIATPFLIIFVFDKMQLLYFAPLTNFAALLLVFSYAFHLLFMCGLFERIPTVHRIPIPEPMFRSAVFWAVFLPISRISSDVVMWVVTGQFYEVGPTYIIVYVALLVILSFGCGLFFFILYLKLLFWLKKVQ